MLFKLFEFKVLISLLSPLISQFPVEFIAGLLDSLSLNEFLSLFNLIWFWFDLWLCIITSFEFFSIEEDLLIKLFLLKIFSVFPVFCIISNLFLLINLLLFILIFSFILSELSLFNFFCALISFSSSILKLSSIIFFWGLSELLSILLLFNLLVFLFSLEI